MFNPIVLEKSDEYDFRKMDRDLDRTKSSVFLSGDAAFFGPLMCTLEFVWAKNLQPPTAATDYSRMYWHPDDFLRCRVEEKGEDKSTIMHELKHVAYLHGLRQGDRCPDIWNIACDIKINRDLRKDGYYIGPSWIDRKDLDHLEVEEEIYDWLINPGGGGMKPGQVPAGMQCQCSHGQVPVNAQTKQAALNAVVNAKQSAEMANQPGSIPGNLEDILNKFLKPKVPWQGVLYRYFTDLIEENYTWARPNRRYQHMYLPSSYQDEGRLKELTWYMDVSGSVSDKDAHRMASELHYIWTTFKPKKLTIVLFDTMIQEIFEFNEDDKFDKLKIIGRGGTCFKCVREHILETKPTCAIIMSDMYVAPMEPDRRLPPIIWISVNNEEATVPFGTLINIKE